MADQKLADLTALTTPSGDDILYIVDDPAGTPLDRKIALDNLFTRGTITASAPVLNMSQTWNNEAVTFTGLKFNVTDTASAAASLLMDIGTGGGTYVSRFSVTRAGVVNATGNITGAGITATSSGSSVVQLSALSTYGTHMARDYVVSWGNNATLNGSLDLILSRRAAANLRLGAADAAAPVAQTLSVQSVVAGTTNTAGANLTITGSQGTGTGAGGSIVFQVAPAGSSGSAQNALASAFQITSAKNATFYASVTATNTSGGSTMQLASTNSSYGYHMAKDYVVSWGSGATLDGSLDVILARDAANTLALRNGANAQAFRVYNTTNGTNSESLNAYWAGNTAYLLTVGVGTGPSRNLVVGTAANNASLAFWTNAAERWSIGGSTGHLLAGTDNTYDIGASGANRPRNVYVGTNIISPQFVTDAFGFFTTSGGYISFFSRAGFESPADGVIKLRNAADTDFNRLQFGGTTSSFPALKRSTTTLQARLADDSAFASVQGKLTTDTAYTATVIVPTGYLTLYDSTGTAYRVPCVV
jgi:hypothetical protein